MTEAERFGRLYYSTLGRKPYGCRRELIEVGQNETAFPL